jgi:hypothetical protein
MAQQKRYPTVARQQLGKNVTTATLELLDASFSMWTMLYQGK